MIIFKCCFIIFFILRSIWNAYNFLVLIFCLIICPTSLWESSIQKNDRTSFNTPSLQMSDTSGPALREKIYPVYHNYSLQEVETHHHNHNHSCKISHAFWTLMCFASLFVFFLLQLSQGNFSQMERVERVHSCFFIMHVSQHSSFFLDNIRGLAASGNGGNGGCS